MYIVDSGLFQAAELDHPFESGSMDAEQHVVVMSRPLWFGRTYHPFGSEDKLSAPTLTTVKAVVALAPLFESGVAEVEHLHLEQVRHR